jgi:hypothetical protein
MTGTVLAGGPANATSYVQETPQLGGDPARTTSSSSWSEVVPVRVKRNTHDTPYGINPAWLPNMLRQLEQLIRLPKDWDSYGASPMSQVAIRTFAEFLRDNRQYIRSSPLLSLTSEGGILARWESRESELDLYFEANEPVEIVFEQYIDSHERSGPASQFAELAKWLWQSSAAG